MLCPKCGYLREEHDTSVLPGVCPACGIAYAKYRAAVLGEDDSGQVMAKSEEQLEAELEQPLQMSWQQRLFRYVCFMPSDRHESAFWGHSVIFLLFLIWGWYLIMGGPSYQVVGTSFLHNVNLPFHEYGHVMFSPFGDWWMLLGGSLFQIILPLFPLGYFMVMQRDNFAASLMLWWSGENFLDVSVYIADAPVRALPLTTSNEDAHDWWNLLLMSGSLDSAAAYAWCCFLLGVAVMALSNVWGGFLLYVEFRGRTRPDDPL